MFWNPFKYSSKVPWQLLIKIEMASRLTSAILGQRMTKVLKRTCKITDNERV